MIAKSKSLPTLILSIAIIFLVGCTSNVKPVEKSASETFSLSAINGVPKDTNITLDSLPKEIPLTSNDSNTTRKIDVSIREKCYTEHPFGFETYSGEFFTQNNDKLNRLSYPEHGSDSLFVVDEYGYVLSNDSCLTFSYNAAVKGAISGESYDKTIYSKELEKAAEIMKTLTIPKGKN